MWLAKIAQTPGSGRNNTEESRTGKKTTIFAVILAFLRSDLGNGNRDIIKAADNNQHHDGRQNQGKNHQSRLHRIRPAHREEAADKSISNRCARAEPHRLRIRKIKKTFKKTRPGDHTGSTINSKEEKNNGGGNYLHCAPLRTEAVEKIIRQRQRIIIVFRMHAQATCHQQPIQIRADRQTNGNPCLAHPGHKNRAGQSHQQPAGHIRSARRHCCHEWTQTAPAQNIIIKTARRKIRRHANQ